MKLTDFSNHSESFHKRNTHLLPGYPPVQGSEPTKEQEQMKKEVAKAKAFSDIHIRDKKNVHAVALGRLGGPIGGKSTSDAKKKAARINGSLGGRPPKIVDKL